MGILKRTSRAPLPDEHLTFLTLVEGRELRRLVEAAFAKTGHDVTVHSDLAVDRHGTSFALWNIASLCRGVDRREWPGLIDEHVRLVTTVPCGLDDLSRDELRDAVHLRLVAAGSVADTQLIGYARQIAPELLEVIAVDLPDSVATLDREDLAATGTLAELMERGRANLRRVLETTQIEPTTVPAGRGEFTSLTGDSFFTASLALLLPDTVDRFTGEADRGYGILVAVPDRHRLAYRVVDGPTTGDALRRMFDWARAGWDGSAASLSPNVFWVRDRRWSQVTSVDGGKPRVWLRGDVAGAIRQSA
jgi:hypothetical protein